MFRQMLRSKIHRATVTEACLDYEGSLTVDEDLLEAAGIQPYEAIFCSNLNNGERFMTYAMKGKRGGGEIVLNGPTARKARRAATWPACKRAGWPSWRKSRCPMGTKL